MRNENRWVDNAVFELKDKHAFTHYQQYLEELEDRPIDSHFNTHKGYKYDVPVQYEDRVPYMADRLGKYIILYYIYIIFILYILLNI